MRVGAECLPHKYEELPSDPQHQHKGRVIACDIDPWTLDSHTHHTQNDMLVQIYPYTAHMHAHAHTVKPIDK